MLGRPSSPPAGPSSPSSAYGSAIRCWRAAPWLAAESVSVCDGRGSTDLGKLNRLFSTFARWTAHHAGQAYTFILATAVVVVWLVSGPLFGFSDTWQLVINTGTTIVTFL